MPSSRSVFGEFRRHECVRNGTGVREPGGFNDHIIKTLLAIDEVVQGANQITAHAAAKAAIVQFHNFLIRADDELVVNAHRAEFVDDDGAAIAVLLREQMV